MDKFPHLRPSHEFLNFNMSLLKPRLYSVSSSPKEEPNRVQLTLGVREAGWKSGMGICSEWLNTIEINHLVPISLRKYEMLINQVQIKERPAFSSLYLKRNSNFKLPANVDTPVILVANGTGIAPYRSFWEDLKQDFYRSMVDDKQFKANQIYIYFGCHSKLSELYKSDIEALLDIDLITKYYPVYSREPGFEKVILMS